MRIQTVRRSAFSTSVRFGMLVALLIVSWTVRPVSAQGDPMDGPTEGEADRATILNINLSPSADDPLFKAVATAMARDGVTLVPAQDYQPPLLWVSITEVGEYQFGLDATLADSMLPSGYLRVEPDSETSDLYLTLGPGERPRAWSFERAATTALGFYALGRCDDAVPYFERALRHIARLEPGGRSENSLEMLFGNCLVALGRYADAADQFQAALIKNPDNPICCGNLHANVAANLAWTYRTLDQFDDALDVMDQLIEAARAADNGGETSAAERAALLFRSEFLADAALADATLAVELDPTSEYLYYRRALLYIAADERELAIADFERVIEMEPDGYYADLARDYLNGLATAGN